jgi:branched-chain amino acid transport system ATP-binding protein
MTAAATVLEVSNVSRSFGELAVLKNVSFSLAAGQSGAIIGPNGAGKTTLVNVICGVYPPSGGRIQLRGEDVGGLEPHKIARKGLVRTYQITSLFQDLTVFENIEVALIGRGKYRPVTDESLSSPAQILELVGLQDEADRIVHELSHGDQRLLEIGVSVAFGPDVLLLDEPTAGMSPLETSRFITLVNNRLRGKCSIVLIEHDMEVVMKTTDKVCVLANGAVIAEDVPEKIGSNKFVREAYLGHS